MNDSERLDDAINDTFQKLKGSCGNQRDDYYGLAFLEHVLKLPRSQARDQNTFGNHDFGVDGFCWDEDQGAFRIFQFKNSRSTRDFAGSMTQLIEKGIPALFGDIVETPDHQPIIVAARKAVESNKGAIQQVFVDFVFRGNAQDAEQSSVVKELSERIAEDRGWMVQKYFDSSVPLSVRSLSFDGMAPERVRDNFHIRLSEHNELEGPDGMRMYVGFVPLIDLVGIHSVLGRRFLERNIRFALAPESPVNESLARTFASMLLQRIADASLFVFHHNGVTLSAGKIERKDRITTIWAPRLLNGAQTISTFGDFWERNGPGLKASGGGDEVDRLLVPCRIITNASMDAITEVTISNNRQNPVKSWQLHANDTIQLKLEEYFKDSGIPYQRQDRAFSKLTAEEWQEMGFTETKAIELMRLARTYLAVEGELTKLTHIQEVFDRKEYYDELFGDHRLRVDPRRILLCYKAQFRVNKLADEIAEKGKAKYSFVYRTKDMIGGLVCQALLNDDKLDNIADSFGGDLIIRHEFTDKLRELASTRVRFLLNALMNDPEYEGKVQEGNFSFMRTTPAFRKAMKHAKKQYGWDLKLLRG